MTAHAGRRLAVDSVTMSTSPAPVTPALQNVPAPAVARVPGTLARPLHPGLSAQVRSDGSLQLGLDPVHGVVLTGLAEHERGPVGRLVALLCGATGPALPTVLARAVGLPAARVAEVARALEEAGLTRRDHPGRGEGALSAWSLSRRRHGGERSEASLGPLPLAERRAGARVVVDGRGPLVTDIAGILRAAGVGEVVSGWYAGAGDDQADGAPDPGLVITVGRRLPGPRASDWLRRSIAHLPVVARPGSVDVGPLVVPGPGPCLSCVRLHEGTPILSDLGRDDLLGDGQDDPVRVEPSLSAVVAGTVAMLALGLLDAYPPPVGVRWHTALPLPSVATSRWPVHPHCEEGRHRRRDRRAGRRPDAAVTLEQGGTLAG